ncbi:glycosyltransferase family 2 protein [uncultured Draconibacterium sp.]|uniref:glycosyltransferase family 2 protein n=1 Tax=uncultured Draconibacterium sp. TaxID=1573823 RepID=UPI0029C955F0|nr:glycosyltransferase family 2 protein [uncultured Draconibacterium sp.]
MKNKLVSILLPTYNQQQYLKNSIESALNQDYENIEIIIADDASTDHTKEIVSSYIKNTPKIKYFRNEYNLGRVANYHKALYEHANGDYVLNLDGDDQLIDNTFISDAVKLLNDKPNTKLLVACKQFSLHDKIIKTYHKVDKLIAVISGLEFVNGISKKYEFSHLTTLYNRKDALKLNFYRENIISTDKESLLRLALTGDIILYNKIVGQWNYIGTNDSKNQSFYDSTTNLTWITNVYVILKTKTTYIKATLWKERMKLLYAPFIAKSIKNQKSLTLNQVYTLFKNKIVLALIVSIVKITFNKLFLRKNK